MTDKKEELERLKNLFDKLSTNSDISSVVDCIGLGICLRMKYSYPSESEILPLRQLKKKKPSSFSIKEEPSFSPERPILRNRKPTNVVEDGGAVHEDMLRMANEMKEVAGGVRSMIKRDTIELSNTLNLQDLNIQSTSKENMSAEGIRRKKRLSFFYTIFMIFSSLIIFIVLFFLIVVVT